MICGREGEWKILQYMFRMEIYHMFFVVVMHEVSRGGIYKEGKSMWVTMIYFLSCADPYEGYLNKRTSRQGRKRGKRKEGRKTHKFGTERQKKRKK